MIDILFFSRSRKVDTKSTRMEKKIARAIGNERWQSYLSNFTEISPFIYAGEVFQSVEHAYQHEKLRACGAEEFLLKKFCYPSDLTSGQAKSRASQKAIKDLGLQVPYFWKRDDGLETMRAIMYARYASDKQFRKILELCKENGITLHHFERFSKSFWGGYFDKEIGEWIGKDSCGRLLNEL
jgi:predicted NAD-dependent protein-ADP-ribosyltransferase YbiA (DUF1768 family)